jgi:ATP-dependent Zn protease
MSQHPTPPPPLSHADPAIRPPPRPFRFGVLLGWAFFIGLAIMLFLLLSRRTPSNTHLIPLSEFATRLEDGGIHQVVVERDQLTGTYVSPPSSIVSPGTPFRTTLPPRMGENWGFLQWLLANRGGAEVVVHHNNSDNLLTNILLPLIPWLLIFGFLWLFIFRLLRRSGRQNAVVLTGPGRWVPDPQPSSQPQPQPEANRP